MRHVAVDVLCGRVCDVNSDATADRPVVLKIEELNNMLMLLCSVLSVSPFT